MADGEMSAEVESQSDDLAALVPPTSRRTFLALMAGSAAAAAISGRADAIAPVGTPPNFALNLTRTIDLIDIRLEFHNLYVGTDPKGVKVLAKVDALLASYMVVQFPAQHVAEETLYFNPSATVSNPSELAPVDPDVHAPYGTTNHYRALPLRSRISGGSRLVFSVDTSLATVPYTTGGLLNWTSPAFSIALPATAAAGQLVSYVAGPLPLVAPTGLETAIEFPYGLLLSPTPGGRWRNRTAAFTVPGRPDAFGLIANRTEVWGTDLAPWYGAVRSVGALRPVWANFRSFNPDSRPGDISPSAVDPSVGFPTLPSADDKWQLLHQTTDRRPSLVPPYFSTPPALAAHRFRMSSIGATADLRGDFTTTGTLNLEAYVHRTFGGRDVYVKVQKAGYLYPTGHRASLLSVSERVFAAPAGPGAATGTVAYLQEYELLVVRERTREYTTGFAEELQRAFPFTSVTINIDSTPPITRGPVTGLDGVVEAFFPTIAGSPFRFDCTVIDQLGHDHRVRIPLMFVFDPPTNANQQAPSSTPVTKVRDAYNGLAADWRTIELPGLDIGFAPFANGARATTTLPTVKIVMLGGGSLDLKLPTLDFAKVLLDIQEKFTGSLSLVDIEFPKFYLTHGFTGLNEKGLVFAAFKGAVSFNFPDLRSIGGLFSPDFSPSGLSASLGLFSGGFHLDVPNLFSGTGGGLHFDPSTWFSGLPKLFGGIDLTAILPSFTPPLANFNTDLPSIPGFSKKVIYGELGAKVPVGIEFSYKWCTTQLQSGPAGENVFVVSTTPPTSLCVSTTITVKFTASGPTTTFESEATLSNFKVQLIGESLKFLTLDFESLSFVARQGAEPKVRPVIRDVAFDGAAKFVSDLAKQLTSGTDGGFTPTFNVSSSMAEVGFTFGLPAIAVGAFSLKNVNIGMGAMVPFDGSPLSARFNVCRPDSPFLLAFGFLGGGGHLAIEAGIDGIHKFEVSLEFGATLQVDLGVASGGVSAMAGINILLTDTPKSVELSGYFRMNGHVSVLGIVSMSCEVLLTLAYDTSSGNATGRASVSFHVEVLFFSTTVSAEVEKTFGGESATPHLQTRPLAVGAASSAAAHPHVKAADYLASADWATYRAAFDPSTLVKV